LRSYFSLSSLDFYIGWFVHLPEVLFPLLSHCFPIFMFVLDIIFIFLRSWFPLSLYMGIYFGYNDRFSEALLKFIPNNCPLFPIFFPYGYYVLENMSIFPRFYFSLLFIIFPYIYLYWMVIYLFDILFSYYFHYFPRYEYLYWILYLFSQGFPYFPFFSNIFHYFHYLVSLLDGIFTLFALIYPYICLYWMTYPFYRGLISPYLPIWVRMICPPSRELIFP
jgi:hypothetical protein